MKSASVQLHTLSHHDEEGTTTAAVAPEWGANVVALHFQSRDWATPSPILESVDVATVAAKPTSYGMPLLFPTPGRVGRNQSGDMVYRGATYRLSPARHGFGRNLAWEVADVSAGSLTCVVDVQAAQTRRDFGFPFQLRCEHKIELGAGTLGSRVRLTNTGEDVQPVAVGWHPYFHRSGTCRVRIPAAGRWQLDDQPEPAPTGQILPVDAHDDFRRGRPLTLDHWDDIFTDLTAENGTITAWVEETAPLAMTDGTERRHRMRRFLQIPATEHNGTRPVPNLQLYTPQGRDAISLEPLSAPPDALNLLARDHPRASITELAPGERADFEIVIGLEVCAAR